MGPFQKSVRGKISPPRPEFALFFLLFAATAYFHHPVEYDNTLSRFYLLSSVVDHGRLDLGSYAEKTVDVSAGTDGLVYSNKAIGLPLLATPWYWLARRLTPLGLMEPLSSQTRLWCVLLTTTLPFALVGVLLFRFLRTLGAPAPAAYWSVTAWGLGTIAWIHAGLFSGHQAAANFALVSFALLAWPGTRGLALAAWAGLAAGLATLCDYPAILIAASLAGYAAFQSRRRLGAFIAGAAPPAALLLLYNAWCFGSPWTSSYARQSYPDFTAAASRGLWGIGLPQPEALAGLLVSPSRGLFFIMPVLLMALPGLLLLWKKRRREASLILAVVAGTLTLNAGLTLWHGGWAFGPRYLTAMIPFLIIPLAFSWDARWFFPLLALSALQVGTALAVTPHVSEYVSNPLIETMLPLWKDGYRADTAAAWWGLSGLGSVLPLLAAAPLWTWWGRPREKAVSFHTPAVWKAVYAAALIGVMAGLALVRSPEGYQISDFNGRLARDMLRARR